MNVRLPRLLALELTVIATGLILWMIVSLLGRFEHIVLIFGFSVLLTYGLLPVVNWLDKHMRRGLALLVTYLTLALAIFGFVVLVSLPLAKQVEQLASEYPKYVGQAEDSVTKLQREFDKRNIGININEQVEKLNDQAENSAQTAASKSGEVAVGVFGTLSSIIIVFFVTIYFLLDGKSLVGSFISVLPAGRQRMVKKLAGEYHSLLSRYVGGQLFLSLLIGLAAGIFSWAIGLPYAVIIGVVAGITELIPVIGAFLGAGVACLIALFVNPILIIPIIIFFVIINEIEGKFLYPKIVGKAVDLHPLTVFFGLLIGTQLAGIGGALLATPVLAMLKTTIKTLSGITGNRRSGNVH